MCLFAPLCDGSSGKPEDDIAGEVNSLTATATAISAKAGSSSVVVGMSIVIRRRLVEEIPEV